MLGTHDFSLFILAGLLLNITPGPDMLYIIGRSTAEGTKAGVAAALGIGCGALVHVGAAALGISALLATSAEAFTVVKIIGAVYLAYTGLSLILSSLPSTEQAPPSSISTSSVHSIFIQGFFTNVLNPKVALFFLAFVPQFIQPDAPNKALAFIFLGLVFNCNGTLWNLFVAWFSARASNKFRSSRCTLWFNRCIGAFFIYLGARLGADRTL